MTQLSSIEIEIALIQRLLDRGQCGESKRAAPIIARMRQARWIRPSKRANVWELCPEARSAIVARRDTLLPSWHSDLEILLAHGLDPTDPINIRNLPALRNPPEVKGFLHRKTWNAATTSDSKSRSRSISEALLTDDWLLRGRCSCKLVLTTSEGDIDLESQTRALSEFSIPERGWRGCSGLSGTLPSVIVTVENIGPFVDLVLPSGWMLLYSQGLAVFAASQLLGAIPTARWLHFGDLDAAGIAAGVKISTLTGRPLSIYIPRFAADYVHRSRPVRRRWRKTTFEHPVIQTLIDKNAWLEQELFMLDDRLGEDLTSALNMSAA